jgi:hypothetical protein
MSIGLKIANLLRTPVYLGAKGIELGISIFTPSHNFTFGQFIDSSHYLAKTASLGFETFTEAAVEGSNPYIRALSYSEGMLALYEHLVGIDAVQLYTKVIRHGDIDALEILLARNITKNQILLTDILRTEQDEAARYLIENGFADPSTVDFNRVLCYAASNPTANMTEFALQNGANINFKCWNTTLPIQEAVQQDSIANAATLIKNGAEVPANVIIEYATYDKYLESGMIPFLFSQGISPHYQENNFTAFSRSANWKEYKLASYLLDTYNVDVNIEHSGRTPLENTISACTYHYQPKDCSTDLIRKIIGHGADVRHGKFGSSVLDKALKMSSKLDEIVSDIIEMILCHGKFTAQEVSKHLNQETSNEVRELLSGYVESENQYCTNHEDNKVNTWTQCDINSQPFINNSLICLNISYEDI